MVMVVSLVLARTDNGVIGKDGALPWRLPEDMKRFKSLTWGKPCIMGRKTWESLPTKFRPLPGRANIVVSRTPGYDAVGAAVVASLENARTVAEDTRAGEAMVIGGAQLYAAALPYAQRIYLTEIHADFAGDVLAPAFPASAWQETARANAVAANGLAYSFVTLVRA